MAYAAVNSLKQTIQRLQNSSHISIVPNSSTEILKFAYKEVQSLQEVLKRLDRSGSSSERVNALDGQIREAVSELEYVLESHVSNQFLSQSESIGEESHPLLFSLYLQEVKIDVDSFTQTVKKMKEEYINELSNPFPEEDDAVSSRIDFGGKKSKMVGLFDGFRKIKDQLTDWWPSPVKIVSLVGMAGIGKTTLAKKIFEDPSILSHFHHRVWVTLSPKYQSKEILLDILAKVDPDIYKIHSKGDEILAKHLYNRLLFKRYLIVLDNIWNTEVWNYLKRLLPDIKNGSGVLLTTRLEQVALFANSSGVHQMPFLHKEESWCLLREKVFAKELCPPELERAGKKIAENCEGLPLTIVTVADLLSKAEKTPEYWKKVAERENSVFMDANDQISDVLFPSYRYLPQYLKPCFLYMGVFPQNYDIPRSKLIMLWSAEGFLEPNPSKTVEDFAVECLEELVSANIVMVRQKSSNYGIKTCSLHSAFWHLCIKEVRKNKFFYVLNRYADGLAEGRKIQRRLCIRNSILFAIKDVYNSMASISTVRSLLCTGSHHRYPIPICFGLRLVRVLDALTIRFYEFPMEVLNIVHLRYLALTYNGKLPTSISKLWNLQFLISVSI